MTRTIARIARLKNSVNGNPRWRVTFAEGGHADTPPDASFGYEVCWSWEGRTFDVTFDGRGRLVAAVPA